MNVEYNAFISSIKWNFAICLICSRLCYIALYTFVPTGINWKEQDDLVSLLSWLLWRPDSNLPFSACVNARMLVHNSKCNGIYSVHIMLRVLLQIARLPSI